MMRTGLPKVPVLLRMAHPMSFNVNIHEVNITPRRSFPTGGGKSAVALTSIHLHYLCTTKDQRAASQSPLLSCDTLNKALGRFLTHHVVKWAISSSCFANRSH